MGAGSYVYLAIDLSSSMREPDLKPDRLRYSLKVRTLSHTCTSRTIDLFLKKGLLSRYLVSGGSRIREGVLRPEPDLSAGKAELFESFHVHSADGRPRNKWGWDNLGCVFRTL